MGAGARPTTALAVALLLAGLLGACSSGTTGSGDCDTSRGTLTLGLIAPLSGDLAGIGAGMRDSADLAVRQANERCEIPGYALALAARDDRADPATGRAAAQELAANPDLVGVVGTYNSSTAQTVQPVLSQAGIVEISPGNTNVSLTRGANAATAPLRQYQTYFRVVATDAVQGPAAADRLAESGRTTVAVVSDGGVYGEGLASEFTKQLGTRGGQVAVRTILPSGADPAATVAAIERARPDVVFYGGEYPGAGPLSRALGTEGPPLVGGDGIVDAGYAAAGGRDGDLGASVGVPPEMLPRGREFLDAYARAGYPAPPTLYGPASYDATNVIVSAVATTVAGPGDGAWSSDQRSAVVQAVQGYAGDGLTGPIAFDRFGDVLSDSVTMYRLVGGRWIPDVTRP